ncbi:MAG: tetratricopeptide repeat protein [Nitrospiraceae bacterium]
MRQASLFAGLFGLFLLLVVACEEKKEVGAETAIMAPAGSAGRTQNDEGVGHYRQGHWDVAEGHFRKALQADDKLAEAHFNLALTLDKMDKHEDAKTEFKKALDLAPAKVAIKDSPVLKKHLGM